MTAQTPGQAARTPRALLSEIVQAELERIGRHGIVAGVEAGRKLPLDVILDAADAYAAAREPQPAPENAEVAYEQWIAERDPADVGSNAGFAAGWQAAVTAASGWPLCPNGCGCRLGTQDADARDCACDGLCCYDEIEVSEVFAERDRLRAAAREPQPAGGGAAGRMSALAAELEAEADASGGWEAHAKRDAAARMRRRIAAAGEPQPAPGNAGRPVRWDGTVPPGGYVCAVPDGDGRICGYPVESEPCDQHGPQPAPGLAAVEADAQKARAALDRVLEWFAGETGGRREAAVTRAQLANAYRDGGLPVPSELVRFL